MKGDSEREVDVSIDHQLEAQHEVDPTAVRSARRALLSARVLSQAAKALLYAALLVAGAQEISATGLSAIIIATMAGAILFAIPGGVLADRLGAPRTLSLGTLLRLGAVLAAFTVVAAPAWAWVAALVFSAASQPYTHAELAAVRSLRPTCSNGTHASIVVLQHVGHGAGLLLAPLLYVLAGEAAMIAGAALLLGLTLVATLQFEARLRQTGLPWQLASEATVDLAGTLRFFGAERRARYAAGALAYSDLATKSLLIAAPIYLSTDLDLSTGASGSLIVIAAAGVLLGLLWSGRMLTFRLAPQALRSVVLVTVVATLVLAGLGFALGSVIQLSGLGALPWLSSLEDGVQPSFVFALPAAFAFSVAPVAARTVLTETAPPAEQARVFASVATLSDALVILPLALAGVSIELLGTQPTLLLVGLLGALAFAIFELADAEPQVAEPTAATVPSN